MNGRHHKYFSVDIAFYNIEEAHDIKSSQK